MSNLENQMNDEKLAEMGVGTEAEKLYQKSVSQNALRTDKMFVVLMTCQYVVAIVLAVINSPYTWTEFTPSIHLHVWSAIILGGLVTAFPIWVILKYPGTLFTRIVVGVSQMLMSGLLIHYTNGKLETHFHVFGSLAFLAFYRDWRVLIPAAAVTAGDHLVRGVFWPESVYGVAVISIWKTLEHAFWVVFEVSFLLYSIYQGDKVLRVVSWQRATLEITNKIIQRNVEEKTSELEQTQHSLLQCEKLASVGSLAAGIAHEINTPVQFIGHNTETVKEMFTDLENLILLYQKTKPELEANSKLVQQIEELEEEIDIAFILEDFPVACEQTIGGVKRVSDIVQAMKKFAHGSDADRQSIELIDLNSTLDNTLIVASNEFKYVAEVVKDYGEVPSVEGINNEINQVFMTLLVNSAQALKEKIDQTEGMDLGLIKISTRVEEDYVKVSIEDNGCGIPQDIINRIYEPFFTTKEVGVGSGQGLTLAYNFIVNKHQGKIELDSVEGKGTTFHIFIPVTYQGPIKEQQSTEEEVEEEALV